jgi:hypothetical protein
MERGSMPGSPSASISRSAVSSPAAKSRAAFTPAPPPRGKQVAVYLTPAANRLLEPWAGSRQRSGKLCAIVDRYVELTDHRPEFTLREWAVIVQLLGAFASIRDLSRLWAEVLDRARDWSLPGVDAEVLVRKLRQLGSAEQVTVLEVADRVALAQGSIRERLAAAGMGEGS